MSILDRAALEGSPLADLHAIASELSIDGFRRLRKAELIDRIVARQEGAEPATEEESEPAAEPEAREDEPGAQEDEPEAPADEREAQEDEPEARAAAGKRRRGRRGGRGRTREEPAAEAEAEPSEAQGEAPAQEEDGAIVEGVVELLANGSGFLRVAPPDPTDDDIYISAAQVKRCELVGGDRVSGPKRPPRRSERFASLIRIDTINGRPASEQADGVRFDELPSAFPTERFRLGSDEPTLKAIEFLTPFGRGSRVAIVGGSRAGKSRALRLLADALAADEALQLFVALAGVRPEELSEWPAEGRLTPTAALGFAASADALDHVVELVVEQARRITARGADTVVLIDTLDGLHPHAARRAMASARNLVGGGSLTVIATAREPIGGETTVIALDARLAGAGRYPAVDLVASGTIRPELLVGEPGAKAIADARADAMDRD